MGKTSVDEISTLPRRPAIGRHEPSTDEEARFRNLVQSPLRAGLLRFLSARPDEAFEVEALMSAFGRMRLDVENCLKELAEFGVARGLSSRGRPACPPRGRATSRSVPPATRCRGCSTTFSSAAPPSAPKTGAIGPALPRNDRPRREDADRLRVDPDGGEVGYLGTHP